jgi:farnesyl-diphosphate farnesyltransferase
MQPPGQLGSEADDRAFCIDMLPKVSRTFAICIRLLPSRLDHAVLVAYLLCRVADTIEDSIRLDPLEKSRLLEAFSRCLGPGDLRADRLRAAFAEAATDEEILARDADAVLREFRRLSESQQGAVRPHVQEMCAGMAEFALRTKASDGEHLEALATVAELDRYCYFVAGTVGHLLTELFHLHAGAGNRARHVKLKSLATSFGLGLQLTNIIKDVADDRSRGWSFVPQELCQLAGVTPETLHDARHHESARQVMHLLIEKAKGYLLDALEYSTTLGHSQYRVRLFCLTSLYFAARTLRLAERDDRLLDPTHKVKITRGEVARTLLTTRLVAPSNQLVRWYFRRLAGGQWSKPALESPTPVSM